MSLIGRISIAGALAAVLAMTPMTILAQGRGQAAAPSEPLSALAPENLSKPRPKAPFDLTGNWFVDTSAGPDAWRFGPPYPKLTAKAQKEFDTGMRLLKEGDKVTVVGRPLKSGEPGSAIFTSVTLADGRTLVERAARQGGAK